ncbi:MAG: CBS domain-containing protein [Candidatus Omnitrophica bacterium]|nr:CBS domain-containing protein [Candidatus Omnitrophota bacterium]
MLNVPIQEMMELKVITIQEDALLKTADEKMRAFRIRHLPVTDKDGKLVGLFTQRDLFRILPSRIKESDPVDTEILTKYTLKDVMRQDPEALTPDNPILKAVSLMWERKYGCVPIVDKQRRVIGIITAIDILHFATHFLK